MTLKLARLELARTKEFPDGDHRHGYELRLPLDPDGHIDAKAYQEVAQLCTVRHFRPDGDDEHGQLVRQRDKWAISYVPGEDDDEPVFRLGGHRFRIGEYITIEEHGRGDQVFRVVALGDVPVSA